MTAETHWKVAWADRPAEIANHLNPAFCGELIGRTVGEYHRMRRSNLSVAIAFLILPLTLHKPTRNALPKRANVAFAGWIADKNPLLAELPDRIAKLRPVTREALLFSILHHALSIQHGDLHPGVKPNRPFQPQQLTDDVEAARSAASLLGRWFANQGTQASIMQGMGIAP